MQEGITIRTDELLSHFSHIIPTMKEAEKTFILEYDKRTRMFCIYPEETYLPDDICFLCSVPELSLCEYVDRIYLRADDPCFLPEDESFDFMDTVEIPFDSIDGCNLMEDSSLIASIDAVFTMKRSDQIASAWKYQSDNG
ncbi:MAG: hypothetical protein ACI4UM_04320 [Succinivibrio sp.]